MVVSPAKFSCWIRTPDSYDVSLAVSLVDSLADSLAEFTCRIHSPVSLSVLCIILLQILLLIVLQILSPGSLAAFALQIRSLFLLLILSQILLLILSPIHSLHSLADSLANSLTDSITKFSHQIRHRIRSLHSLAGFSFVILSLDLLAGFLGQSYILHLVTECCLCSLFISLFLQISNVFFACCHLMV